MIHFLTQKKTNTWIAGLVLLGGIAGCEAGDTESALVGYVEGEYVYVAAPQSGWLVATHVVEGSIINQGDVLFELDNDQERLVVVEAEARVSEADARARDIETGARPEEIAELEARLAEAEAALILAESEYDRMIPLLQKELIAPAEGDRITAERNQARARVVVAKEAIQVAILSGRDAELEAARASVVTTEAAVGQAEWTLEQRTVTSRIEGRVEAVYHRKGEFVSAGSPILSVLPEDGVKVRFFVPQSLVGSLQTGGFVSVSVGAISGQESAEIRAAISFVATEAEFTPPVIYSVDSREKLVFMVEARLPVGSALRPGIPVDIRLSADRP